WKTSCLSFNGSKPDGDVPLRYPCLEVRREGQENESDLAGYDSRHDDAVGNRVAGGWRTSSSDSAGILAALAYPTRRSNRRNPHPGDFGRLRLSQRSSTFHRG